MNTFIKKQLILVLFLLTSGFCFAEPVTIILDNGNPANRVDIVIMGDGYSATDIASGVYAKHAQDLVDGIFRDPLFLEYKNYFNVHRVDVTSVDSGITHPTRNINKNTALGVFFNCAKEHRLLCMTDNIKADTILSNSGINSKKNDIQIILVNETELGGSFSAGYAFTTIGADFIETTLHEIAHVIANLGDEYRTVSACTTNKVEPSEPNLTIETNRQNIKWNKGGGPSTGWIERFTAVPTTNTQNSIIGLYQGTRDCATGLYRPSFNSKMRTLGQPFDAVSKEALTKSFYNYVTKFDSALPTTATVVIQGQQSQEFSVTLPLLANGSRSLVYSWILDNKIVGTGTRYQLTNTGQLGNGAHTLTVSADDTTNRVRNDPTKLTNLTTSWNLDVQGSPINQATGISSPINGATLTGSSTQFTWNLNANANNSFLYVGNSFAANDIYAQALGANSTGITVTNMPVDGRTIFVRLWVSIAGNWTFDDYQYSAFK